MTHTVTKAQYQAARYSLDKITPALIGVREVLNPQVVGSDNLLKVATFHEWLKKTRDDNLEIVDAGNQQFENRDVDLINAATARMFQIPNLVESEKKRLGHLINSRQIKVSQLQKNFSLEEIKQIVPEISQAEINDSNTIIAALEKEAKALKAFIDDAPHFDVSLLKNTSLEQIEEVAA